MHARTFAICVVSLAVAACHDGLAHHAPRTLRTTLSRIEGVGRGTPVVMAGLPVGSVSSVKWASDGWHLLITVDRDDAPLHAGLSAEVRPMGLLEPDAIALLPGPAAAPPLVDGAEIAGVPRLATSAERRAALRIILPVIGLPSLGALAGDPRPKSDSAAGP